MLKKSQNQSKYVKEVSKNSVAPLTTIAVTGLFQDFWKSLDRESKNKIKLYETKVEKDMKTFFL